MKKLLILLLILIASTHLFAQTEPAIKKLPVAKKKEIAKLFKDIVSGTNIYSESTDDQAIVVATAEMVKRIRKIAPTIPKGLFRNSLLSGAGAWEKSLWFRYDEIGNSMMSLSKRNEIVKIYKLESYVAEDRPSRLFEFAMSFFDMAANIAVDSGILTS